MNHTHSVIRTSDYRNISLPSLVFYFAVLLSQIVWFIVYTAVHKMAVKQQHLSNRNRTGSRPGVLDLELAGTAATRPRMLLIDNDVTLNLTSTHQRQSRFVCAEVINLQQMFRAKVLLHQQKSAPFLAQSTKPRGWRL